jgi:hypothetical protein
MVFTAGWSGWIIPSRFLTVAPMSRQNHGPYRHSVNSHHMGPLLLTTDRPTIIKPALMLWQSSDEDENVRTRAASEKTDRLRQFSATMTLLGHRTWPTELFKPWVIWRFHCYVIIWSRRHIFLYFCIYIENFCLKIWFFTFQLGYLPVISKHVLSLHLRKSSIEKLQHKFTDTDPCKNHSTINENSLDE